MQEKRAIQALLLYNLTTKSAGTTIDHLSSLEKLSRNRVHKIDTLQQGLRKLDLERFDALIVHYTVVINKDYTNSFFKNEEERKKIAEFRGMKIVFIQDDYRWINKTIEAIIELGFHVVFTLCPPRIIRDVFHDSRLQHVQFISTLAGYVPSRLVRLGGKAKPYSQRSIDVGYRAQNLQGKYFWLGQLAQEKTQISRCFLRDASKTSLLCNISNKIEDRLYGNDWTNFLLECRATLGTEGGASICDFTGEIQEKVELYTEKHPEATFKEVQEKFFSDLDGKIMMNVITPRCFEAASLKTLMINYPGEYSGILQPWRHYVPLAKDHSNFDEVVAILKNTNKASEIVDRAYQEIALNEQYHYSALARQLDNVLDKLKTLHPIRHDRKHYNAFSFTIASRQLKLPYQLNHLQLQLKTLRYAYYCRYLQSYYRAVTIVVRILKVILTKQQIDFIKKKKAIIFRPKK